MLGIVPYSSSRVERTERYTRRIHSGALLPKVYTVYERTGEYFQHLRDLPSLRRVMVIAHGNLNLLS